MGRWPPTPAEVAQQVGRWYPWYAKKGGYWGAGLGATPVLAESTDAVIHLWWHPVQGRRDTKGNVWSEVGSVPAIGAAPPIPAGAGPFTDTDYLSLAASVADFAGDFSGCVVFKHLSTQTNNGLVADATAWGASGSGWRTMVSGDGAIFDTLGPGSTYTRCADSNLAVVGAINVVCFGRAGTSQLLKTNLGSLVSVAGSLIVPAVGEPVRIGRYAESGVAAGQKIIYETMLVASTPSDALFITWVQTVKSKLAITAW